MTNNWEEQTKQMVEQGKQAAAGLISGGEMLIDVDPEIGFFRVKIRNVQPPQALPQVTMGFCWVLQNGAAMFNLQVKQHVSRREEKEEK
jgi:hypothetical protein